MYLQLLLPDKSAVLNYLTALLPRLMFRLILLLISAADNFSVEFWYKGNTTPSATKLLSLEIISVLHTGGLDSIDTGKA